MGEQTSESPSRWWVAGGIFGALGVLLGAFGAHGLEERLAEAELLDHWKTAASYQLIHALALLGVAAHPRSPRVAGVAFTVGIVLFSGSLYVLSLTGIKALGMVTPLGGVAFLVGWTALALSSGATREGSTT